MDVRPIRDEADYDWALREIAADFDAEPVAVRFDGLAALIEACEARVWPIAALDAVSAIEETMARLSLRQADLADVLGSRSRASEILHRKRGLTMEQAWKLHQAWRIPAEVLLRPVDGGRR